MMEKPIDPSFRGLGYRTLASMAENPASLRMEIQAAHHPDVVSSVMTEDQAAIARQQLANANSGKTQVIRAGKDTVERGRIMVHEPTGRRVTVIRASFGKTKGGEDVHEVIDKKGSKFLAKHSNLRPLRD
jgi:hypothetical protein